MKFGLARLITAAVGLVLCVVATPASPREVEIAKIIKRSVPIFTEWDMNQPDAVANRDKAMRAYAEAVLMARYVHLKVDGAGKWDTIFKNYFQPDDQSAVERVFAGISGVTKDKPKGDADGSDYFGRIVIINYRFDNRDDDCEDQPNKMLAWLENIEKGEPNRAVLRICPRAFRYPLRDGIKCSDLGEEVSGKMSSLGGVFLHEATHFDAIGKIATGLRILDYREAGYGPANTRTFNKDNNVPVSNADQYRWFAQEYYWTVECNKDYKAPRYNEDYLKCEEGVSSCQAM